MAVFLISALVAVLLGFVLVRPQQVGRLIVHGGYYYILGVFGLWLVYWWRVAARHGATFVTNMRQHLLVGLFLVAATLFCIWTDTFAHKVLFDEYVLQGTAWHMHLTKEVGTPIRAYDFAGTWLVVDTFLDKRPYFFPFLVSILHDVMGFRLGNVFALNVALAFVILASVFWLVRTITGRIRSSLLAVALLATLPLFGQNATGASMEALNLAMIAIVMVTSTLYLQKPDPDRLSLLVLGTILLAQTRYESVLFVFPVGVVIVLGWFRTERVFLSWPAIAAPIMLVPYAWHDRYVTTKQHLWQLREGEESRFAFHYLQGNLEGARKFFFSLTPSQPNSLSLVLLGMAGILWALIRILRARRTFLRGREFPFTAYVVVALFAITIAANLGLLMFYYWSRLDEPVATRFALPMFLVFSIVAGWCAHSLDMRGVPATTASAVGLLAWLLVAGAPAYAHRFYTSNNLVMHELNWELGEVRRRQRPLLLITAKATLPFLLEKIPALNTSIARLRGPQIAWHMQQGTFREVLVSQVIRPTSAQGDPAVDPDEVLPVGFHLETLAEKRFGARWIRISRLISIESPEIDDQNAGTTTLRSASSE